MPFCTSAKVKIAPSAAIRSVPDAYWWVFLAFHLVADTTCGLVCWSQGRRETPRQLRYGLRLFGTGALLASLLWTLKLAYLCTRLPFFDPLFSPVTGIEALFMAAGAALPLLAQVRTRRQHRKAYQGLDVLWRDLTAATPDVVLGPGRLRAMATPLQLRLYRRVIEIRDAMITLRNYVTPAALDLARRQATDHAFPEAVAEAHVTAFWLTAALHALHRGHPPQPQSVNLAGPGAHDLADEINHLLRVADAYQSPANCAYRTSLLGTG